MKRVIEFDAELTGNDFLCLPPEAAAALPSSGKATVVIFVDMDPEDAAWQRDAYEQFLSNDTEEDAKYDWHEFVCQRYGSCAGLGLDEPGDPPLTSPQ